MAKFLTIYLKNKKEPEHVKGNIDTNERVVKVEDDSGAVVGFIPFENIDRIEVEETGKITNFDKMDPLWNSLVDSD